MARPRPKPGHIRRHEERAERRGRGKAFGVPREVSTNESCLSGNLISRSTGPPSAGSAAGQRARSADSTCGEGTLVIRADGGPHVNTGL